MNIKSAIGPTCHLNRLVHFSSSEEINWPRSRSHSRGGGGVFLRMSSNLGLNWLVHIPVLRNRLTYFKVTFQRRGGAFLRMSWAALMRWLTLTWRLVTWSNGGRCDWLQVAMKPEVMSWERHNHTTSEDFVVWQGLIVNILSSKDKVFPRGKIHCLRLRVTLTRRQRYNWSHTSLESMLIDGVGLSLRCDWVRELPTVRRGRLPTATPDGDLKNHIFASDSACLLTLCALINSHIIIIDCWALQIPVARIDGLFIRTSVSRTETRADNTRSGADQTLCEWDSEKTGRYW